MTDISLQDRIEFALRDAGFDLDAAALLAERAVAAPALPPEAEQMLAHVLDAQVQKLREFAALCGREYPSGTWVQEKLNELIETGTWSESETL